MVKQERTLATWPDNLGLTAWIHMVGENQLQKASLQSQQKCHGTYVPYGVYAYIPHTPPHTHT